MATDKTDTSLTAMTSSPEQYFANLPTRECAFAVWGRIEAYYNEMRRTGRLAIYRNAYLNYYMGWIYRASMWKSGELGELTRTFWNHHRNLCRHVIVQTTQNKIAYKAQVLNSSSASAQIVEFANGLADHYSQDPEYDLDTKFKKAVEDCVAVFGLSSVVGLWNRFKGDPVVQDPATGQIHHDGDMEYHVVTPMDDIFNTTHQSREQIQWRCIRLWKNKYDLAAMYPQLADRVKQFNDVESTYGTKLVSLMTHDSETIPVFYFFHGKTPAVQKGRMLVMADPSCVLEDGPLDYGDDQPGYESIPVYDMIASTIDGSPFGYTPSYDSLPMQQGLNELLSAVYSNNINFATQCVMAMKGANLHYQNLATGMSFIEYDPKVGVAGKPEALNLLHSAPETYQLIDKTIQNMEIVWGVNSLQRGQPDQNITSGQYAALVTVQSVIFNADWQKAYALLCETTITGSIFTVKKNMIGKKIARIVGSNGEAHQMEFTKAKLQDVKSITVELTNPMMQTPAGKMQMADSLTKTGLIKDAQQYISVYADGDLPNLFKPEESQNDLVKAENEALMNGEQFDCAITDNHVMHILQHRKNIDTMEARRDPNLPYVVATLAHMQTHIDMLVGNPAKGQGPINPVLAGIIGDPTLPPGTPNALRLPPQGPPPPPAGAPAQPNGPAGSPAAPAQTLPQTGMPGQQPTGPMQ